MYRLRTHGIEVEVRPFFMPDRSDPAEGRYVWGYSITIANHSDRAVKLLSRHWRITDALGRVEHVRGPGVVGEQPELDPGDSFQYSSGCPLTTNSGIMQGSYTMRDEDGRLFEVAVPAFSLDMPGERNVLN